MDDWTYEKYRETTPESQYHRLFATNDDLEDALIDRIDLRRKDYEYSRNNMVSRSVEQGNYLYSCAEFSTFRSAFAEFLGQPSVNRSRRDLHQFLVANGAEPDLIEDSSEYSCIVRTIETSSSGRSWPMECFPLLDTSTTEERRVTVRPLLFSRENGLVRGGA